MNATAAQRDLLMEIESKHEELIAQLEALDKRIQQTLAECQAQRNASLQSD